jgi:PBP1b-binding outer membrane lipoprotein LpoB
MKMTRLTTTLAAALLTVACSTTRNDVDVTATSEQPVSMTSSSNIIPEEPAASWAPTPIPGPLHDDGSGRLVASSSSQNIIPDESTTMISSSSFEEGTTGTRTRMKKD